MSMFGGGIGQSESTSKQTSVAATGGSQVAFKAPILNQGAILLERSANLNLGTQILDGLKKLKLGRNASINVDLSPESTTDPQLISALAALANRDASPSGTVTLPASPQPGTAQEADPNAPLGTRISGAVNDALQKLRNFVYTEDAAGNKTINTNFYWALGLVVVAFVLWRKFRR